MDVKGVRFYLLFSSLDTKKVRQKEDA